MCEDVGEEEEGEEEETIRFYYFFTFVNAMKLIHRTPQLSTKLINDIFTLILTG